MGSVPQIGLGVLILGAAFVFGHYVQQTNQSVNVAENGSPTGDSIQWQMSDQLDQLKNQLEQTTNQSDASPGENENWPGRMPVMQPPRNDAFDSQADATGAIHDSTLDTNDVAAAPDENPERPSADKRSLMDLLPPLSEAPEGLSRSTHMDNQPPPAPEPDQIVHPDFSQLAKQSPAQYEDSGTTEPADDPDIPEQVLGSRVVAAAPAENSTPPTGGRDPVLDDQVPNGTASKEKQPWLGAEFGPLQEVTRKHNPSAEPSAPRTTVAQRQPLTHPGPPSMATEPKKNGHSLSTTQQQPFAQVMGRLTQVRSRQTRSVSLETNEFRQHQTRAGETLQQISNQYYGTPRFYLDIYLANQDVLENPASVGSGLVLRIPRYQK